MGPGVHPSRCHLPVRRTLPFESGDLGARLAQVRHKCIERYGARRYGHRSDAAIVGAMHALEDDDLLVTVIAATVSRSRVA
jgi:hypothetical protein